MLKALREGTGLTQAELAAKAKVERTYIVKLENGDKKNPSVAVVQRLAKALGASVSELLE